MQDHSPPKVYERCRREFQPTATFLEFDSCDFAVNCADCTNHRTVEEYFGLIGH